MSRTGHQRTTYSNKQSSNTQFWVKGGYIDYQSVFIILAIVLLGIVMVYSASSYRAVIEGQSSWYYAIRQSVFAVVGIVGLIIVSKINYSWYKNMSVFAIILAAVLSTVVLVIGASTNGSVRWIPIGSFQFQPSELVKPAIIIYMAHACVAKNKLLNTIPGIFKICWPPLVSVVLIAKENLSTAIVCFAIMAVIMFVASPKLGNLFLLCLIGVVAAALAIFGVGYRGDRIDAWLHPETSENGFQTMQSLYAIGSGGLFGRGLGQSIQKMGFLPESHNDMIFAIICEELGLFGGIGVLALFVMLLVRFYNIALRSRDSFGGLLITGVITHIAVQLIINIGVVTNTIPPTGVTLPFISYGGTSLVALLAEIGIVMGVARYMKISE